MTRGEAPAGAADRQRTLVVHPTLNQSKSDSRAAEARLAEAVGLASAITLDIVDAMVTSVGRRRPATLFGSGKVEEIAAHIRACDAALVVIDGSLTPVQQRNLERAWSCKVIDRTGLILEIFGARARTREGRLQVELASLSYQRSRLVRSWTHLERQRGGFGFLGGPGESQIEADRRQIDGRIQRIRRDLETVTRTRRLHRQARRRVPHSVVALVGYTNAGKSTLFNRLTQATVFADDRLFATLDPTMRGLVLPSGRHIILSDTVGFVSNLPTTLIAAFRATLEEVIEADLIVHVRDISHADSEAQKRDVHAVLRELGLDQEVEGGAIELQNKCDRLDAEHAAQVRNAAARNGDAVVASALTGEGIDAFLALLDARLLEKRQIVELSVKLHDGAAIAWLYRHGEVIARRDDEEFAHMRVGLDAADLARFAHLHPDHAASGLT